jgi:hypothetical protein
MANPMGEAGIEALRLDFDRRLLQFRGSVITSDGEEGKGAIKWTRLSCRSFAANAVRLQLHALAYNLGNFMRTLANAQGGGAVVADQPAIGAKVVSHGRYVRFQMAEVAVSRQMFAEILSLIARAAGTTRASVRGAGVRCLR